ncbi:MAG: DUF932 domain-containing protein [Candidatus Nanoarchaeia archaeon]|jgi:hypothetical protein|nr:DUF932 domain-containing protein [Candidatus Nanoarchaeia archaeon]
MTEKKFLTENELRTQVPAAFSSSPASEVSTKYVFVPTYKIMNYLDRLGWKPVSAKQVKSKKNNDYGKHMIRFRKKEGLLEKGEIIEEIVYTSSHDRSFPATLNAGFYRCVCSNQMVVADNEFASVCQRHIGFTFDDLEKLVKEIVKQFTIIAEKVNTYKTIELTEVEKGKFAYVAKNMHWGEDSVINPDSLLEVKRLEDNKNDLWTVFNRIQEHIMQGGIHYSVPSDKTGKIRRRTTRQIKNVVRDLKINQNLWMIMAAFATNRSF